MIRRIAAALGAVVLLGGLSSANALAIPPAKNPYAPVMVVLDSSGSMKARDAGGSGTRLDAAKRAVGTMVDQLPDVARLGLAIYGAGTGSAGSDKTAGCRDVRVVQALSIVDKPAFKAAVNGAQARGYTPIGHALRTAAGQLPPEGQRSIVLVSDGEDTCAPPQPCEVAKELHRQGVDLHIHTIGFKIGPAARAQLACIAQATGGTYHDADNADTLTGVLGRVTEQALRHYEPAGRPVTGTADPTTAPALTPNQYVDTLDSSEERFYAVDLKEGETLYFAATAIFPRGNVRETEALDIRLTGPGGADCNRYERGVHTRAKQDGGSLSVVLHWSDAMGRGTGAIRCAEPGRYALRITRDSNGTDRVPVELLVRIEPPVTGTGEPAETEPVEFAGQPAGARRPVRGGGSFNEATTLPGSGRYGETIYYGEQLYYRVKLDWGQGIAYRITYGGTPDGRTVNVSTALHNPVRDEIDSDSTAYTGDTTTLPSSGRPIATSRVMYLNRSHGDVANQKAAVDGWYYLMVKLGSADAGGVPVTIDVAVAGTKAGGPQYGKVAGTPTTTGTASPTTQPSGSATPVVNEPGDAGSGRALPWVIAGLAVLVAVGGAAALITRRRANPGSPGHS